MRFRGDPNDEDEIVDGRDELVEVNPLFKEIMKKGIKKSDFARIWLSEEPPTSYLAYPVTIGFMQPLNGYNSLRWDRKIEPLKYEEAKLEYINSLENVSKRAVGYFFDLALAQIVVVTGWGDWFPWSIPALFSGAVGPRADQLGWYSYLILLIASLIGLAMTFNWWRNADQTK